jgi:hypothetical protein
MVAIETRYHGPTDYRGARITATANGNRVTVSYPYELSGEDCHRVAAEALCAKMKWPWKLIGGGTNKGYVFVFADRV